MQLDKGGDRRLVRVFRNGVLQREVPTMIGMWSLLF